MNTPEGQPPQSPPPVNPENAALAAIQAELGKTVGYLQANYDCRLLLAALLAQASNLAAKMLVAGAVHEVSLIRYFHAACERVFTWAAEMTPPTVQNLSSNDTSPTKHRGPP